MGHSLDGFRDPLLLLVSALAVYRLTRLLVEDEILARPRAAVIHWRSRDGRPGPLGYFATCPWCVSVWTAGLWALLLWLAPTAALVAGAILAWSAAAGLLASRE